MSAAELASKATRVEQMNEWMVRANGRGSSPALLSRFLAVLNHSASRIKRRWIIPCSPFFRWDLLIIYNSILWHLIYWMFHNKMCEIFVYSTTCSLSIWISFHFPFFVPLFCEESVWGECFHTARGRCTLSHSKKQKEKKKNHVFVLNHISVLNRHCQRNK